MRLIDADELLTHETTIHVEEVGYSHRSIDPYWVKTAPTIEAKPLKHGRWINDKGLYKCSVCNNFIITGWDIPIEQMNKTMKYCNNCGAKMDEVEE